MIYPLVTPTNSKAILVKYDLKLARFFNYLFRIWLDHKVLNLSKLYFKVCNTVSTWHNAQKTTICFLINYTFEFQAPCKGVGLMQGWNHTSNLHKHSPHSDWRQAGHRGTQGGVELRSGCSSGSSLCIPGRHALCFPSLPSHHHRRKSYSIPAVSLQKPTLAGIINWYWMGRGWVNVGGNL